MLYGTDLFPPVYKVLQLSLKMSAFKSLHCIAEAGDAKALSAMLVGQVDVDMVNRVSMQLYRCD